MIALALLLATAPLDDAAAALAAGDAGACGENVRLALESGALDVAQVARAWTLRGQCFTLAGDGDRAERSYAVALRVDPGLDASRDPSLAADAAFATAKRSLPGIPGLSARVAAVDDDTIELELLGDDLLLVKGALLLRSGAEGAAPEEVARVPLEAGQARHKVSGVGRQGLTAVLVDKSGNALMRLPVDPAVQRVFAPAPAPTRTQGETPGVAPTVLTTVGATAIGAGIVGIVASGIGLAALGPTALDEGTVWLVGVGASTGLFLVGAGLVVVDQGL